jgi:hypothetical protein
MFRFWVYAIYENRLHLRFAKAVLAAKPNNFEALSVYAYIEAWFQDYRIAADLYRSRFVPA